LECARADVLEKKEMRLLFAILVAAAIVAFTLNLIAVSVSMAVVLGGTAFLGLIVWYTG
jgi:hypothetical protein